MSAASSAGSLAPRLLKALAADQWRRPIVDRVSLRLPMPPSTNRLWRPDGRGGITLSDRYRSWKRVAATEIAIQRPGAIEGPYVMDMRVSTRHGVDLDNTTKAVGDALQAAGVVSNDNLLSRLIVEWADDIDGVEVVLTAWQGRAA
jgi:crossover junction endodeoxyribonuclease RusA